jgi:hypothetical protein
MIRRPVARRPLSLLVVSLLLAGVLTTAASIGPAASPAEARIAGFVDVRGSEYYAAAVAWMRGQGLTTGVGPDRYHPIGTVDRAQMATFLWRLAGSPSESAPHGFRDVPTGTYYEPAVRWLRARGLTTGVGGSDRFEPLRPVNRAEIATFLWRYEGSPTDAPAHGFRDVPAGSYYDLAVRWLVDRRITTGVGGSDRFAPADPASRGQMATFVWRYRGSPPPPNPGGGRSCGDFLTQPEAQGFFDLYRPYYGDVAGLAQDGIACPGLPASRDLPRFTPEEYKELQRAVGHRLPGTAPVLEQQPITGDAAADARIQWLAGRRGYRLTATPTVGLRSSLGVLLHPEAAAALDRLAGEARSRGLTIGATSGHRSIERQREIFRARLGGVSTSAIARGDADGTIEAALRFNSIPGTSKHHTGHTVDLHAGGSLGAFEGTATEVWLRSDDFRNAKRHGWVPSYPRGAAAQGPEPEPWEYVHLGVDVIRCAAFHIPMADPGAPASCPAPPT